MGTHLIRLSDGRLLAYAEYGDRRGWPLLFCHGTPGSRVMARFVASQAQAWGIRLLAPERPGYGLSDPQPHRRLLDWPEDVRQLADALGLARFGIVGVSGGGPYTAACTWRLPERIQVAGIVSGLAPPDALGPALPWPLRLLALLLRRPWWLRPFLTVLATAIRQQPQRCLTALLPLLPCGDRAIMSRPEVQRLQLDGVMQAWRQGVQATLEDLAIFSQPWGVPLAEITVPVYLWHGNRDRVVPVAMGRYLAAQLPTCRARFVPEAGHLWIFEGYNEVIKALLRSE
ncbi:MAG: alpha/beta fold hydrolase [Desulfobacca sp.]|uniref:alpha/beta fold hydrolase n=1 Tax=Desulfobacca sp. TaxID=2067990 RepID=UPI004049F221